MLRSESSRIINKNVENKFLYRWLKRFHAEIFDRYELIDGCP
jgi:hypothetical protein